jgi:hypothetical protein
MLTVSRIFMNVANSVLWRMAINLKANKVNLFLYSDLFVFWYDSPKLLETPRRHSAIKFPHYKFSLTYMTRLSSRTSFYLTLRHETREAYPRARNLKLSFNFPVILSHHDGSVTVAIRHRIKILRNFTTIFSQVNAP